MTADYFRHLYHTTSTRPPPELEFEEMYLEHLRGKHSALVETIHKERQLAEKTDAELKSILDDFVPNFSFFFSNFKDEKILKEYNSFRKEQRDLKNLAKFLYLSYLKAVWKTNILKCF